MKGCKNKTNVKIHNERLDCHWTRFWSKRIFVQTGDQSTDLHQSRHRELILQSIGKSDNNLSQTLPKTPKKRPLLFAAGSESSFELNQRTTPLPELAKDPIPSNLLDSLNTLAASGLGNPEASVSTG